MTRLSGSVRRPYVWGLLGLTAAAAALRFASIGDQSFWYDEVVTVSLVRRSLGGMLSALPGSESAPPTYYVLAWLWSRVFGTGEFALRSLSALVGTLTIPVAYAAAATLVSRRIGLLVAALATTSPLLVWYSQEARAYSLAVLLAGLSFYFFARALERQTPVILAAWAAFSILAFATHYFAAFTAISEAAVLLVVHRRRVAVLLSVGTVLAAGVALAPLVAHQARLGHASWIGIFPLRLRVEEALRMLVTPAPAPLWAGAGPAGYDSRELWWAALALVAVTSVVALRLGSSRERRAALLGLGIGGATLAVPLVLGSLDGVLHRRLDYFLARNVISAWLPLAVFVAAGLGAPRCRVFGLAAVAGICLASLAVSIGILTISSWQRDDWRSIARRLARDPHAVVVKPLYQEKALRHYDTSLAPLAPGGARLRDLDVLVHLNGAGDSVTVPSGFTRVGSERLQNWTLIRFRAATPIRIRSSDLGPRSQILVPGSLQQ